MSSLAEEYLRLGSLQTRIDTHKTYSELPDDIEQNVLDAVEISPQDAVLDVGCGTGSFLALLRERGHRGTLCGVDTSPAAVTATAGVPGVQAKLGDAAELPFETAEFDVVAARHMLYHVAEPMAAIREARRVLRARGRFVATVNHADPTPHIAGVVRRQAVRHGCEPPVLPMSRVHSGNLPSMVESAFRFVTAHRHDNALVFHTPEPAIRYGLALLNFYGVADDTPQREDVVEAVIDEVRAWFAAEGGPWRDPKGYVVCVASNALS
jgi:ubiquinone/menaquinone biosynthesis C-methylase UbiE